MKSFVRSSVSKAEKARRTPGEHQNERVRSATRQSQGCRHVEKEEGTAVPREGFQRTTAAAAGENSLTKSVPGVPAASSSFAISGVLPQHRYLFVGSAVGAGQTEENRNAAKRHCWWHFFHREIHGFGLDLQWRSMVHVERKTRRCSHGMHVCILPCHFPNCSWTRTYVHLPRVGGRTDFGSMNR